MLALKSKKRYYASAIFTLLVSFFSAFSYAEEEFPKTAHETIGQVSEELLSQLEILFETYEESADKFYAEIDQIVSPWIDYDSFYKGVMGRKYYTEATQQQRDKFKAVFQKSLIETYGKGLLGVEETDFEIEPPSGPVEAGKSVPVKQTLFSGTGRIVVIYTMGQAEDGRWRLKNVILEGINLGKTFRNQFARSAREFEENLDLVIENWAPEV